MAPGLSLNTLSVYHSDKIRFLGNSYGFLHSLGTLKSQNEKGNTSRETRIYNFWQRDCPAMNAVFFNDFDENGPQNPIFFLASRGGRGRGDTEKFCAQRLLVLAFVR